jgi:hypothetical protein
LAIDVDYFLKQIRSAQQPIDSRSAYGTLARGTNVYNAAAPSAPGAGRPVEYNPTATTPQNTYQFPFDPEIATLQRDLLSDQTRQLSELGAQRQRLGQDFDIRQMQMQQQQQADLESLANRFASQGILRSGINIGAQGRLGEAYQRQFESGALSTARGLEDILRQETDVRGRTQEGLNVLLEEQGRRSAALELQRALQMAQMRAMQQQLAALGVG